MFFFCWTAFQWKQLAARFVFIFLIFWLSYGLLRQNDRSMTITLGTKWNIFFIISKGKLSRPRWQYVYELKNTATDKIRRRTILFASWHSYEIRKSDKKSLVLIFEQSWVFGRLVLCCCCCFCLFSVVIDSLSATASLLQSVRWLVQSKLLIFVLILRLVSFHYNIILQNLKNKFFINHLISFIILRRLLWQQFSF